MSKEQIKFSIKIIISAGILIFLIYKIDFVTLIPAISSLKYYDFGLLAAVFAITIIPAAIRWNILLKSQNKGVKIFRLYKFYLIGYYFNNFLPTGVGGDIARAWMIVNYTNNLKLSVATIFIERILGLAATLSIALVVLPFVKLEIIVKYILFSVTAFVFIIIVMVFNSTSAKLIKKCFKIIPIEKMKYKAHEIFETIHIFKNSKKDLFFTYLVSIIYQATLIFYFFVSAFVLDLDVKFQYFLVFLPIIWIMSMIPISFNAFGVREAGFAFFFEQIGRSKGEGVLVSLLGMFIIVIVSLIGGIFFITSKKMDSKQLREDVFSRG